MSPLQLYGMELYVLIRWIVRKYTHTHTGFRILLGHTGISIRGQGAPQTYIVRSAGARGGNTEIL